MKKIRKEISSWGNNFQVDAMISVFNNKKLIKDLDKVTIHGNGRSYGDSALGLNILKMEENNKVSFFDSNKGIIDCNSGIKLKDLNSLIVPKGWFLPVSPGTSMATIGGCVASDVHGKNHFLNGSFTDHIISIKLMKVNGSIIEISNSKFKNIYKATCGGMGLTGIIVSIKLKLMKINSSNINQIEKKFIYFDDLINAFYENENNMYNVGWIDFLNTKNNKLNNVFLTAYHSDDLIFNKIQIKQLNIPFKKSLSMFLNDQNMKIFNKLYYYMGKNNRFSQINYNKYFYILDFIKDWNLFYGKRGLLQFHFIIPDDSFVIKNFNKIFMKISKSKAKPYLSTFKRYSSSNENYLSFYQKGFGLALDFPNNYDSIKLIKYLEKMVIDFNGKVYLCKDSLMSKTNFKKSYKKYINFKKILNQINPDLKFKSMQSDRLGIT